MNGVSLRDASKGGVAVDVVADELASEGNGLRGDLDVLAALVDTAGPEPTDLITHGLKTERPTHFLWRHSGKSKEQPRANWLRYII